MGQQPGGPVSGLKSKSMGPKEYRDFEGGRNGLEVTLRIPAFPLGPMMMLRGKEEQFLLEEATGGAAVLGEWTEYGSPQR